MAVYRPVLGLRCVLPKERLTANEGSIRDSDKASFFPGVFLDDWCCFWRHGPLVFPLELWMIVSVSPLVLV